MECQGLEVFLSSQPPIVPFISGFPSVDAAFLSTNPKHSSAEDTVPRMLKKRLERGDSGVSSWLPSAKLQTVIHAKIGRPRKQAVCMEGDRKVPHIPSSGM